jgi:probable addiction module antidote protein
MQTMTDVSHDDAMAKILKDDPSLAVGLINDILSDGDAGELLVALRQLAKAYGGVSEVARAADLNPTQVYRTLSHDGNPSLRSLSAILRALGLRLAVEPLSA